MILFNPHIILNAMKRELPIYQSHKKVQAVKIKEIVYDKEVARKEGRQSNDSALIIPEEEGIDPIQVNHEYLEKHKPQVGGYFVRYNDGYESWSPSGAFEEGYTRETLN